MNLVEYQPMKRFWVNSRYFLIVILSYVFGCISSSSFAAETTPITFDATRVFVKGDQREGYITITNVGSKAYLVLSNVQSLNEENSRDFIVSPPSSLLLPNANLTLRVVRVKDLSQDRETASFLRLQMYPSEAHENKSGIDSIFTFYVKVFYRPSLLVNSNAVSKHSEGLRAKCSKGQLVIQNPSPYWMSLTGESFEVSNRKSLMIPPKEEVNFKSVKCPKDVSFKVVLENGFFSSPIKLAVSK